MHIDQAQKSSTSTRVPQSWPLGTQFMIASLQTSPSYTILKRAVGNCLTEECVNSMFEEWPAINVANQYFTPRAVACLEDIQAIGIDIDPFGSLRKAASLMFMHTEKNKVYYFQRKESADGDTM